MADAAVELDAAVLDGVEDVVFADEGRAGAARGRRVRAVRVADHCDPLVGVDGVRQAQAVAHYGSVLQRA